HRLRRVRSALARKRRRQSIAVASRGAGSRTLTALWPRAVRAAAIWSRTGQSSGGRHMRRRNFVLGLLGAVGALTLVLVTSGWTQSSSSSAYKAAWIYVGPHQDGGWSQAH